MPYSHAFLANDFARPLPAINDGYNHFTTRPAMPRHVGIKPGDLDFFRPGALFTYGNALYSADFARRDGTKLGMVGGRDPATTNVFIDSGGYGFIGGGAAIHDIADLRREALIAQERLGDAGVIVDVPTACIGKKIPGATTFKMCLDHTLASIDYAVQRRDRRKPLRLLNMIQGTKNADCRTWYGAVREASLDGFGFAGARRKDMRIVLELLVCMIRDQRIDARSRFHVFGTNHPGIGIYLTAIQRRLRRHFQSDELLITFDSSTSFRFTAQYGQIVTGLVADGRDVRLAKYKVAQEAYGIDAAAPWPWDSPIGRNRAIGDFMPGTVSSQTGNPVDETGAMMLSNHSLYRELEALFQANRLFDMEHGDDWQGRQTTAIPWAVHKGVERINIVFDRVDAGDFPAAITWAREGKNTLDLFADGHDPDER